MDDIQKILLALEGFNQSEASGDIPQILDEYLQHVAATGLTQFPWLKLKELVARKLCIVIADFEKVSPPAGSTAGVNSDVVSFNEMKSRLIECVRKFNSAPFTIQRLCELLMNPMRHYKTTEKFMRGVEKNLLVVSTVDPLGNKIVKESAVKTDTSSGRDIPWATPHPSNHSPGGVAPLSENISPPQQTSLSSDRTFQLSWIGTKPPSPFDSPSVRGCWTSDGSRRRPSPYPHCHEPRKRLRIDTNTKDGAGCNLWTMPLFGHEESPAVHSPILGHLLSDKDGEDVASGSKEGVRAEEASALSESPTQAAAENVDVDANLPEASPGLVVPEELGISFSKTADLQTVTFLAKSVEFESPEMGTTTTTAVCNIDSGIEFESSKMETTTTAAVCNTDSGVEFESSKMETMTITAVCDVSSSDEPFTAKRVVMADSEPHIREELPALDSALLVPLADGLTEHANAKLVNVSSISGESGQHAAFAATDVAAQLSSTDISAAPLSPPFSALSICVEAHVIDTGNPSSGTMQVELNAGQLLQQEQVEKVYRIIPSVMDNKELSENKSTGNNILQQGSGLDACTDTLLNSPVVAPNDPALVVISDNISVDGQLSVTKITGDDAASGEIAMKSSRDIIN